MKHQTIQRQCYEWLGHMRNCDNAQRCQQEQIRLTHDQAMRLCFELASPEISPYESSDRHNRAHAAYAAGRPWDLLAGCNLHGWLVPMERK